MGEPLNQLLCTHHHVQCHLELRFLDDSIFSGIGSQSSYCPTFAKQLHFSHQLHKCGWWRCGRRQCWHHWQCKTEIWKKIINLDQHTSGWWRNDGNVWKASTKSFVDAGRILDKLCSHTYSHRWNWRAQCRVKVKRDISLKSIPLKIQSVKI